MRHENLANPDACIQGFLAQPFTTTATSFAGLLARLATRFDGKM